MGRQRLTPQEALEYVTSEIGYSKNFFYTHISKLKKGNRYLRAKIDDFIKSFEEEPCTSYTKGQIGKIKCGTTPLRSKTPITRMSQSEKNADVLAKVKNLLPKNT